MFKLLAWCSGEFFHDIQPLKISLMAMNLHTKIPVYKTNQLAVDPAATAWSNDVRVICTYSLPRLVLK